MPRIDPRSGPRPAADRHEPPAPAAAPCDMAPATIPTDLAPSPARADTAPCECPPSRRSRMALPHAAATSILVSYASIRRAKKRGYNRCPLRTRGARTRRPCRRARIKRATADGHKGRKTSSECFIEAYKQLASRVLRLSTVASIEIAPSRVLAALALRMDQFLTNDVDHIIVQDYRQFPAGKRT